jgi:hypothetical protein
MKRSLVLWGVGLLVGAGVLWPTYRLYERDKTWRFIKEVLLEVEYGDQDRVVVRWSKNATISVPVSTPADSELLDSIVAELNQVLNKTSFRLELNAYDGEITVFIMPNWMFKEAVKKFGCEYPERVLGYGCLFDNDYEIFWAAILISEEIKGSERRSLLLEEITQSLGPTNDSPLFRDSLFYEKDGIRTFGKTLSPLDRKLLYFLYAYLKPGDREADVRRAFDEHWDSIDIE